MKYVVVLTDGMADEPYEELGGLSPMEKADVPLIDALAARGEIGLVTTVPATMAPGSDVANLAVMGYDPKVYHTGRSPLEAISMGIALGDTDVAMRCNLVTLSKEENFEDRLMLDYSAGEISTEEASLLIADLKKIVDDPVFSLYPGISYRHALVWSAPHEGIQLTPPHDFLDKSIREFLPKQDPSGRLLDLMKKSADLLLHHPVNQARIALGKNPANAIWLWGLGKKTILPSFETMYGKKGAVISAVDLIKGIALAAGMESIDVPGATGTIHTDFNAKAQAALEVLTKRADYLYLHLEASDECSHQGELYEKIRSLELIEQKVIRPIVEGLRASGEDFRLLILSDHPTPVRLRTHTRESVPFVLYDSRKTRLVRPEQIYSERVAGKTGFSFPTGPALAAYFLER